MDRITRYESNEEYACSTIVTAGGFAFIGHCAGNIGGSFSEQVNGALDEMERRLKQVGLGLDSVVSLDALMRDCWNIPEMERIFRERFNGKYPVRKTIETNFAHIGGKDGLQFQLDGIAFKGE